MRAIGILTLLLVAICNQPSPSDTKASNDVLGQAADQMVSGMNDIQAVEASIGPLNQPDTRVTAAKYAELSTGMTYSEVANVMGSAGEQSVSSSMPGVGTTEIYTWKNGDGSNMSATFQNDALMMKAQTALP